MNWRTPVAACLVILCAATASAQFDSAQVSGVVQDIVRRRAARRGRRARRVGTGLERRAVTNEAGLYTFPNVPVGDYRINATLSGFKPIAKTGVRVNAGVNIRVDIPLEVGALDRDRPGRGGDDARRYRR